MTDEVVEGQYKSAITGNLITYLPWEITEPNGLEDQNYIAIHISSSEYVDKFGTESYCLACDLDITAKFSLIGVCKHTFFGKNLLLVNKTTITIINALLESTYMLNNAPLEFRGMHSSIW